MAAEQPVCVSAVPIVSGRFPLVHGEETETGLLRAPSSESAIAFPVGGLEAGDVTEPVGRGVVDDPDPLHVSFGITAAVSRRAASASPTIRPTISAAGRISFTKPATSPL